MPAPQPPALSSALRKCSALADQVTSISMSVALGRLITMQTNGHVYVFAGRYEPPTTRQRIWLKPASGWVLSI